MASLLGQNELATVSLADDVFALAAERGDDVAYCELGLKARHIPAQRQSEVAQPQSAALGLGFSREEVQEVAAWNQPFT